MDDEYKDLVMKNREFLKDRIRKSVDFSKTEQNMGLKAPPTEKPYTSDEEIINLEVNDDWESRYNVPLARVIKDRKSHRKFRDEPLSLEELSFLLWAVQGVRKVIGINAFRTVPSAGCRHAMETYLAVFNITGLKEGIYRYLPLSHQLVLEFRPENIRDNVIKASFNQSFAGKSSLTFIWTAIPHRMEWKYGPVSHKVIALDAGHIGENLYLACGAISAGTCAIGAYDQDYADKLMKVDGVDEFVIYMAPVGKI